MRLTNKLYAQHLGWMFKKHWQIQGKRNIEDFGSISELKKHNIKVTENCTFLDPAEAKCLPYKLFDFSNQSTTNLPKLGYVLSDSTVLVQGLEQALALTKTIKIDDFPTKIRQAIENNQLSSTNHKNIKKAILESIYFDTQQVKTHIIKNPDRPTIVLPRNYGITDSRKNQLLVNKLIAECEKIAGKTICSSRKIVNNDISLLTFKKNEEIIQLHVTAETIIFSKRPIEAIEGKFEGTLPDLYPMSNTISIPRKPLSANNNNLLSKTHCSYSNPHTIFLHFSPSEIINYHGTPTTTSQFHARNLLKAFGIAVLKAQQMYGNTTKQLPQPIVVQSVQTDGKTFHFGIFQLNTLDLNGNEGITNYWFNSSNIDLYNLCKKSAGTFDIDSYNKNILSTISAFYNNS